MSLTRLIFTYGDPVENAANDEAWARELQRIEDERKKEEEEKQRREKERREKKRIAARALRARNKEQAALNKEHNIFMDEVAGGVYEGWDAFPL